MDPASAFANIDLVLGMVDLAHYSPLLPLQQQKSNTRFFTYKKDIDPPDDDEVLKTIEAFKTHLEKEFLPRINKIAQCFYKRDEQALSVGQRPVWEKHDLLMKEQESLIVTFEEIKAKACAFYKYIPFLSDSKKVKTAATTMLYMEVVVGPIEQKSDNLYRLLASQHYRQALQEHKKSVDACEELRKKVPLEDKISSLSAIFTEAKSNFKKLKNHICATENSAELQGALVLHEEALLFCQYTAKCLTNEIPNESTEYNKELVQQIKQLAAKIQKYLPDRNKGLIETNNAGPLHSYIDACMDACKTIILSSEHLFGNAIPGLSVTYTEIWPEIQTLQGIARALYKIHTTMLERIRQLTEGNSTPGTGFVTLDAENDHYTRLINSLERFIIVQMQALIEKPLSSKCHEGWNYVAQILAQVTDARSLHTEFTKLVIGPFTFCIQALGKLVEYLDIANTGIPSDDQSYVWLEPTQRLWQAIMGRDTLSAKDATFHKRVFKLLNQTLCATGIRTLALTPGEAAVGQKVFSKVFANKSNSSSTHDERELLESYLLKNLLRLTRFTESNVDIEFELVLHCLKNDRETEAAFTAILHGSKILDELYCLYTRQTSNNNNYLELQLISYALFAMGTIKIEHNFEQRYESKLSILTGYYQARQMLEDLKHKASATLIPYLQWLERKINEFKHTYSEEINIDSELQLHAPSRAVFLPVVASLYSSNSEVCEAATIQILHFQQKFSEIPTHTIVGTLLRQWILYRFLSDPNVLTTHEHTLLHNILIEYLTNTKTRTFWRRFCSLATMEKALYQFAARCDIRVIIEQTRNKEHYDLWAGVITCYTEFKNLLKLYDSHVTDVQVNAILEKVKELFGDLALEADENDTTSHLGIARMCYSDMLRLLTK